VDESIDVQITVSDKGVEKKSERGKIKIKKLA
jgi:hypothetical protein